MRYLSRAETVSQDELRIIDRFLTALHRKGLLHEGALAGYDRDDEMLA